MNYSKEMICNPELNISPNENPVQTIRQRYKNLKHFEFAADLDNNQLPAFLSILVPINNHHIILLLDQPYGSNDMRNEGLIDVPDELHGHMILCKLWILDDNKIHFQVIQKFLGEDDCGDPAPVEYLLNDKKTIFKITKLIIDYYFGVSQVNN